MIFCFEDKKTVGTIFLKKLIQNIFISWLVLMLLGGLNAAQAEVRVTYYHTDALGSTVAATDESGKELWRESYRPYGERIQHQVDTSQHSLFYTGKEHDDDTDLTYFGARYYDSNIGRFMGMDPVSFSEDNPQSFNRYAYVNNNPYAYTDPDGRILETGWDLFNIGLGAVSFGTNLVSGNFGGAALDFAGLVVDVAAAVVPGVPGGAGFALKSAREGAEQVGKQLVKHADDAARKLANDAHAALDPIAQKYKTTAVGKFEDGSMGIASSDKYVPGPQKKFAEQNNLKVINGEGHAEETLINAGAKHVDASRGVCSDCQNLINSKGVTTSTPFTGKKSRGRR